MYTSFNSPCHEKKNQMYFSFYCLLIIMMFPNRYVLKPLFIKNYALYLTRRAGKLNLPPAKRAQKACFVVDSYEMD